MIPRFHVHVIDDERIIRDACKDTLSRPNCTVTVSDNGCSGLSYLNRHHVDVVVLDLRIPDMEGMDLLRSLHNHHPDTAVVVITGYPTVERAVNAMKLGACDFLPKPFPPSLLRSVVARALETRARTAAESGECAGTPAEQPETLVGVSPAMTRLRHLIRKAALTDCSVLITGETGTGKELVARSLHRLDRTRMGPFVAVDCGGLVETLIESELFGHVKGAFTGALQDRKGRFELARDGTLFLDEISNMDYRTQGKMLRVLQEKEICRVGSTRHIPVNPRIVAASNSNLASEISNGGFRVDLYYRLNVIPIHLPPLRERPEDIPHLVDYFMKRLCDHRDGDVPKRIGDKAMAALIAHDWPGNVRELEHLVKRAVALGTGPEIDPFSLPGIDAGIAPSPGGAQTAEALDLESMERRHIERMLRSYQSNITRTARTLGIDRKTLRAKIRKYGISPLYGN